MTRDFWLPEASPDLNELDRNGLGGSHDRVGDRLAYLDRPIRSSHLHSITHAITALSRATDNRDAAR